MKSNIQKVYSKLPKVELSEVELATQKVELGLVDDIQDSLNTGDKGYQKALRINDNVTNLYKKLNNVVDDIDNMKIQLSNISDAENGLGYAIQVYKKTVPKLEQQSKELGISPKEIKGYTEIQKMIGKWEKELEELKTSKKAGNNILSKIK